MEELKVKNLAITNSSKLYFVLIDPDRQPPEKAGEIAKTCEEAEVDALLVGSSLLGHDSLNATILAIKKNCQLPVILFPGGSSHMSPYADAVLFMSLLSGRNAEFLIGEQVKAAGIIKHFNLQAISTAYLLVDGGKVTSVEFMSNTKPLPSDKPDIAVAHALAAKYFGFKTVYLEAGSGALRPVDNNMIAGVKKYTQLPIIVGGGIKTPEIAAEKIKAGANVIVTGNILEKQPQLIREIAKAIKNA